MIKRKIIIFLILVIIGMPVGAKAYETRTTTAPHKYIYHWHNESAYQRAYQKIYGGEMEHELPDHTRVDLLTDTHAIEFDFCVNPKIYEAVGQVLHYAVMTGKKPKIVLILDRKYEKEQKEYYYTRIERIGKAYNIDVEYITDDILNLDKDGHCPYKDCKCNKNL